MKAPSPLLGFNNNVRHKGRVFHIQTEDSGVRHPHVITHLFADGGRILKTTKTSYAEHLGQDRLAETVRQMMQEQHKAMFIALRDGQFDYLFDEGAAPPPSAVSAAGKPPAATAAAVKAPPPEPPAPPPEPRALPPEPPPVIAEAPPASRKRPASRPRLEIEASALHAVGTAVTAPFAAVTSSTPTSRSDSSIDLDLEALERAAAEAQTPFNQQIHDLPPPPSALLGSKRPSPGSYSVRTQPPTAPPSAPRRPSPKPVAPPMTPSPVPGRATGPAPARYAPSRPASIFATTRPQEGTSIFGEDLISEKSLDEVILSYLAEDLDAPNDKK